jgi:hypothetical protein
MKPLQRIRQDWLPLDEGRRNVVVTHMLTTSPGVLIDYSALPKLTADSRCRDEVEYFSRGMTAAELERYARNTTKRPLLWFAVLAALPFVGEGLCRLLGA